MGDVQYTGAYHEYRGGYHEYSGGYHEYIGGEGAFSTLEGYHDNCGGRSLAKQLNLYGNPSVLNVPRCTHDIPQCTHGIPSVLNTPTVLMIYPHSSWYPPLYSWYPPTVLMISPQCTEHPRCTQRMPQCTEHPPVYCTDIRAVFHQAKFSARNIFSCLLTPTLRQLVFKQKKMSLRAENSA